MNDRSDTPAGKSQRTEPTESFDGTSLPRETGSVSQDEYPREKYGRYVVQSTLGVGGFGRVYLAEDDQLKRLVALKIPKMTRRPVPMVLELHRREAQTVAALDLPGVVPIYDIGMESDGTVYIVSKYIRGSDLYELMDRGALSRESAVLLCKTIAETLHAVHLHSIVHRDIKPGNILVDDNGNPFVADFGLALRPSEYGKAGGKTGTLRYMSPEQVRGESHLVDGRSDLFSLGVILYELLTGARPFDGPDMETVHHCIQHVEPKPLRQIDDSVPAELERICLKTLAKKASDRYATGKDLAEDLGHWIGARQRAVGQSTMDQAGQTTANVVPRGLRAFRGRDSGFFLDLLPGPRDREGLPDLVRHWKMWIQERSSEDECRVGVIYGPSGCGKSSMLQAGILPLLGNDIDVAMIQATTDAFDRQLRRILRRRSPPVGSSQKKLEDFSAANLIAHRRENLGSNGKPLLLVIDQFEHWLLNCSAGEVDELAMTLRQCDGVTTKAILLVRDDFWVALGRFMSVVDVPLIPDSNCSLVDLFDPAHAMKVLESFGRAYNRLPPSELIESSHQQFLVRAIDDLTRAGKVYPVQLALFADMLKGRPWVPETLDELGGVEGIGTRFLEDAFEAEHAPVQRRMHEKAARHVLQSLLPDAGGVRTRSRPRNELLEDSGYAGNPAAFTELILILDGELRLISPVDRLDNFSGSVGSPTDSSEPSVSQESTYQLSHDFLIPSLREWVSRKQLETYRGRVAAQMSDLGKVWSARHARRFLPSWSEWLKFKLLIPNRSLSDDQRLMMRFASRRHVTSTAIVFLCLLFSVFLFRSWYRSQRTGALVNQLESARFSEVPAIAFQLHDLGSSRVESSVRALAIDLKLPPERLLAAKMVLHQWEPSNALEIVEIALTLPPDTVAIVGEYLQDGFTKNHPNVQREDVCTRLLSVLEDQSAPDQQRLAAGQLLVSFDRFSDAENEERQRRNASDLSRILIEYAAYHPGQFGVLATSFRPVAQPLFGPLSSSIGADEPSLESSAALNFLREFLSANPKRLADVALDASPWQLSILVPEIARHPDIVVPFLRETVRPLLYSENQQSRGLSQHGAIRTATAAALLARLSESEPGLWNLLRFDPNPTLRRTLIERFHEVGVPRERLLQRLVDERKETAAALMLALGEYPTPGGSELGDLAIDRVLQAAVGARNPGTMSAANWLVKRWSLKDELRTQLVSPPGGVPASPNWRKNPAGMVMVRIDAQAESNIARVYEIATTEVSITQFQQFDPHVYYAQHVARTTDCPINVVSWHAAIKFCRWLSELERFDDDEMCYPPISEIDDDFIPDPDHLNRTGYRLPTVAEWSHACRGGTEGTRFFGSPKVLKSYAAFRNNDLAMPCGSLKPNDIGLFDMLGNLMEWTGDIDGNERVLCGGSYVFLGNELTSSFTRTSLPGTMFNSIGFRVVRTIEP